MQTEFDLIVRDAVVIEGTGAEPFKADLAAKCGRIAAIGRIVGRGTQSAPPN